MSEREVPTNDPETAADPRVLALLQAGSPANGIDLVPWWRANVAALEAPPKPRFQSFPAWASFAAVFLVGISLGVAGSNGMFAAPAPTKNPAVCKYDEKERSALTAVIDASAKLNAAEWTQRRTALVTLCSNCHVGRFEPTPKPSL
jgi:hypothetical protein